MDAMTEQDWFESGPITREILGVWLEILNKSEREGK
jgi:hypothetical protein